MRDARVRCVWEGTARVSGYRIINLLKGGRRTLGKSLSLHLGTVFSTLIYLSSGSGSALPLFVLNRARCYPAIGLV